MRLYLLCLISSRKSSRLHVGSNPTVPTIVQVPPCLQNDQVKEMTIWPSGRRWQSAKLFEKSHVGSNPTMVTKFFTYIYLGLSSSGSGHLPYKEKIVGSTPTRPTKTETVNH